MASTATTALPKRQRSARTTLLSAALVFVAIQAALSALIAWGPPTLKYPGYGHKLQRLKATLAESQEKPLLVVGLGSSRMDYGLCGSAAVDELAQRTGRPVVVYNFGQPGAQGFTQLLYLRRLLEDGIRPDLLLVEVIPLGVSPRPPADAMEWRLPAVNLRRSEEELIERYVGPHRPLTTFDWTKSWLLPSYFHRFALVSQVAPSLLSLELRRNAFDAKDRYGWTPCNRESDSPQVRAAALAFAKKSYSAVARFGCIGGGKQQEALEECFDVCRRAKIPVALIILPEGRVFRSWYPSGAWDRTRQRYGELCSKHDATFIDCREWFDDEALFLDSHHLLPEGAKRFTQRLARDVLPSLLTVPEEKRASQAVRQ